VQLAGECAPLVFLRLHQPGGELLELLSCFDNLLILGVRSGFQGQNLPSAESGHSHPQQKRDQENHPQPALEL
jgi:hypothetical protein